MRPIPQALKKQILTDPYYLQCARSSEGGCEGRITFEHAIIYAGKQLNELWAIIPLCEYHHAVNQFQDGGNLNKMENIRIALNRATDAELERISKAIDYRALRDRLNKNHEV